MVRLQGVGKVVVGMQHLPSDGMKLEGVGCAPDGELNFAGFEGWDSASGVMEPGGSRAGGSHQWILCAQGD